MEEAKCNMCRPGVGGKKEVVIAFFYTFCSGAVLGPIVLCLVISMTRELMPCIAVVPESVVPESYQKLF